MRRTVRVLALFVSTVVSACSGSTPTELANSPIGTYALTTINGLGLPQLVAHTELGDLELVSASLDLKADQSYSSTYAYRTVGSTSPAVTSAVSGTWAIYGSTVTYYPAGSSPSNVSTMRWDGATLTLVDADASVPVTLVFRK